MSRGSKLDDLIYFRVTSSSSPNHSHEPDEPDYRSFLRPGTARSLPTPNTNRPRDEYASRESADDDSLKNTSLLHVDYSDRPRNLSYPSVRTLPSPTPPQSVVRLINVAASKSTMASSNAAESEPVNEVTTVGSKRPSKRSSQKRNRTGSKTSPSNQEDLAASDMINPNSTNESSIASTSPVSPKNFVLTSTGKSNLEYFLHYSRNPFTTKYEIIGNSKGIVQTYILLLIDILI